MTAIFFMGGGQAPGRYRAFSSLALVRLIPAVALKLVC